MTETIAGVTIPDSPLATEATALLREAGTTLLLNHSLRSFLFGSVQGRIRGQSWDPELLYVGAIFHDLGLTEKYRSAGERFEVDGANAASAFLHEHGAPEDSVGAVWDAVALHTTSGIPPYKRSSPRASGIRRSGSRAVWEPRSSTRASPSASRPTRWTANGSSRGIAATPRSLL